MSDSYWRQESPIGWLTVHSTEIGVHRIELGDRFVGEVESRDERVAAELDEYFGGTRREFGVGIDLSEWEPHFGVDVLRTLHRDVGWGETVSYGELADMTGHPRAARAIGNVMARNPIPVIIPCHRVIAANRRIGGYGPSGVTTKRALLAIEGVTDLR